MPVRLSAVYPIDRFLVKIYVTGSVEPMAIVRIRLIQNVNTSSGIDPTSFRHLAE
jgi:hypothetical protein